MSSPFFSWRTITRKPAIFIMTPIHIFWIITFWTTWRKESTIPAETLMSVEMLATHHPNARGKSSGPMAWDWHKNPESWREFSPNDNQVSVRAEMSNKPGGCSIVTLSLNRKIDSSKSKTIDCAKTCEL